MYQLKECGKTINDTEIFSCSNSASCVEAFTVNNCMSGFFYIIDFKIFIWDYQKICLKSNNRPPCLSIQLLILFFLFKECSTGHSTWHKQNKVTSNPIFQNVNCALPETRLPPKTFNQTNCASDKDNRAKVQTLYRYATHQTTFSLANQIVFMPIKTKGC